MSRKRCGLLVLVALSLSGCADVMSPSPRSSPHPSAPLSSEVAPVEEEGPLRIREASASFIAITPTGYTTLTANMRYDGDRASIDAETHIRESSGSTHTIDHAEHTGFSTWGRNMPHSATYTVVSRSKCGALVESIVQFEASLTNPTLFGFQVPVDPVKTGREPRVFQQECAPCPAGARRTGSEADGGSDSCVEEQDRWENPGEGGGGECPNCLDTPPSTGPTYCRVRQHYWLDTGEIFRTDILWCM